MIRRWLRKFNFRFFKKIKLFYVLLFLFFIHPLFNFNLPKPVFLSLFFLLSFILSIFITKKIKDYSGFWGSLLLILSLAGLLGITIILPNDLSIDKYFIPLLIYVFFLFTIFFTLILFFLHKTIFAKKYQLAFNIIVSLILIVFGYLLFFDIKNLTTRLTQLENRFGGPKKVSCNEKDSIKKIKPSVVRVIGGQAEGSGFVFTDYGLVITNFHVIQFEPAPKIMFSDNTFETAEIVYADQNYDLAILMINKKLPGLKWGDSDALYPAEELLAVGYPFGSDLIGEATIKKGGYSGKRLNKENGLVYIQTDMTLNEGMSGGPVVNVCGEVIGINTAGTGGLSLAISSNSFKEKKGEIFTAKDPLKDVQRIEFNPNKSPLEAVLAFYNYIKIRKLEEAYKLLSDNFLRGGTYEQWKKGYAPNMDTSVLMIEEDPEKENLVNVKLMTKDLIGDEIITKYFEGWWEVKEIDGQLKLWWPLIREVEEPDWLWFYE